MERIFLSFHYDDAGKSLAIRSSGCEGAWPKAGDRRAARRHGAWSRNHQADRRERCADKLADRACGEPQQQLGPRRACLRPRAQQADDRRGTKGRRRRRAVSGARADRLRSGRGGLRYYPACRDHRAFWRQTGGRIIPVQIEPKEAAQFALDKQDHAKIEYRFWKVGEASDWLKTNPFPKSGGVLAYLRGVPDGHEIKLRIDDGNTSWSSDVESQTLQIPLKKASS